MTETVLLADFDSALARARDLAARPGRTLLGVCGAPGSGKTTLAVALSTELAPLLGEGTVAHIPMDGFHLADVELRRLGRLSRKGAPDTYDTYGYAALLSRLRAPRNGEVVGEVVYAPQFERDLEQPIAGAIPVDPHVRLVVSEGNYLLAESGGWESVGQAFDEVWYLDSSPEVRIPRLVERHITFGKGHRQAEDWVHDVDEHNAAFIERTRARASVIVTGFTPPRR